MTLLTRDCADIIEANIRYHRAQGVDLFVVGDDGSVDGTLEILEGFERSGLVKLEPVSGLLHEVWSKGRTKLARLAHELGADWVIHNDQDEFWWSLTGDLKETLVAVPDRFGLVVAPRTEFVGRPGEGPFAERLTIREARFLRPPKAAHRTHPRIVLDHPHPTRIGVQKRRGSRGRRAMYSQAGPGFGLPPPTTRRSSRTSSSSHLRSLSACCTSRSEAPRNTGTGSS